MTFSISFLSTDGSQYFPGYSCQFGQTLVQTEVSTDRDTAYQTVIDGLFEALDYHAVQAHGTSDDEVIAAIADMVNVLPIGSVYFDCSEDDTEELDLNVYALVTVTYDCRITYSYVDPAVDTDGDYSDHGYAVVNPEGITESAYDSAIRLPLHLKHYSAVANDLKSNAVLVDLTLDSDDLEKLCESGYLQDPQGKFVSVDDLAKYLASDDDGWYTIDNYHPNVQLNVHRIG